MSSLISYVQHVAGLHADDQRREFGVASQGFAKDPGLLPRLRLALLLCMPGTAVSDDNRALGLLEPVAAAAGAANAGALQRFAALLHAQVGERVREQKRSAQLREQLDALKAMERSLMERGQRRIR